VDLPGSGTADMLPARYGLEFLADAVAHMLAELRLPPVNVMGGSYGSLIAYVLAQRHPSRVRRLLLSGTGGRIPPALRAHAEHTMALLLAGRVECFARSTVELFMSPGRVVRRQQAVVRLLERRLRTLTDDEIDKYVQNTRRLLDRPPAPRGLPATVPTLVTTGEHDTFTTPAMCREVALSCADARFTTIQEADHLPHLERMDDFLDLMVRFFGDQPLDGLPYCNPLERLHRPHAIQQVEVSVAPMIASMM
jgi:pimeloyl-ACP methyl ester carboxylesterase